jgi:hypothetical protein
VVVLSLVIGVRRGLDDLLRGGDVELGEQVTGRVCSAPGERSTTRNEEVFVAIVSA